MRDRYHGDAKIKRSDRIIHFSFLDALIFSEKKKNGIFFELCETRLVIKKMLAIRKGVDPKNTSDFYLYIR